MFLRMLKLKWIHVHGVESNNQLVIEWISELVSQSVSQVVNALLCVRKLFFGESASNKLNSFTWH